MSSKKLQNDYEGSIKIIRSSKILLNMTTVKTGNADLRLSTSLQEEKISLQRTKRALKCKLTKLY